MHHLKSNHHWLSALLTSLTFLLFTLPAFGAPAQIDDREQGLRLLNLKRYSEAEELLNQALKTNPSDPKSYHLRGMARLYQNRLEGATQDFQKALQLAPSDTDIMASLGKAHYKSGQSSKAVKVLDQAVKTDPDNFKAVNQLAWVLAVSPQKQIRNGARAVTLAKRLVAKDENVHTLDTLAAAYAANKEYQKAVTIQEKALAILANQSRLKEVDPYMARLKAYRQNRSWIDQNSTPPVPSTAKKSSAPESQPAAEKPPLEKPEVAKPAAEKPQPEKPEVAKPAAEKPVAVKAAPQQPKPASEPHAAAIKKKSPLVSKSKTRPKRVVSTEKWPPPFYPYVVQIASFPNLQKAYATANRYRQKGDPAYTAPITLEKSGNWYRVFFGWHTDADSAAEQVTVLKERNFSQPAAVKKPYTILIESTSDMNKLERIERRLIKLGQLPYRLADREKKGYWRMLVGAYSLRSIPPNFKAQLRQEGFEPKMVLR